MSSTIFKPKKKQEKVELWARYCQSIDSRSNDHWSLYIAYPDGTLEGLVSDNLSEKQTNYHWRTMQFKRDAIICGHNGVWEFLREVK